MKVFYRSFFSLVVSIVVSHPLTAFSQEAVTEAPSGDIDYELSISGGWPHMMQISFGKVNGPSTTSLELGYTNLPGAEGVQFSMGNVGIRYQHSFSGFDFYVGSTLGAKITTAKKSEVEHELVFEVDTTTTTNTAFLQPFVGYRWFRSGNSSISTELGFEWAYWYTTEFKSNSLDLDETGRHSLYATDVYEKNRKKVKDAANKYGRNSYSAKLIQYHYAF